MMDSKNGFLNAETSSQDDDSIRKPYVGMEFDSEDVAMTFYAAYARRTGFTIKVGEYGCSNTDEPIISWDIFCSRREIPKRKNVESCNAMLKIERKNSNIWVVTKFVEEHNHPTSPEKVHNLRPRKNFAVGTTNMVKTVDTVDDVRPCHLKRTLGKDGQNLLDYLKRKQAESPGFFYAIQLDDENRLTNVFWADARSRMAYTHFGDAVVFDTMYRPGMYLVAFAPFTGINHHGQMVLFGCALILDESEASFTWLFKTWLLAMNGKPPMSITTDQDRAIKAAVSQVLPQTRHCISRWHILREGQERLARVYLARPLFYGELYSCINFSEMIQEFESAWCSLLDKYDLRKNEWLEAVYDARRQWAPVFFRDTFFASISSNPGVETFFDGYVNQQTTLPLFFKQYEMALEDSLEREIEADQESMHTDPALKTPSPMEQQAADQYTRKIFVKFQEELVETFAYTANQLDGDERISKYRVAKYEHDHKAYIVTVNASDMKANCSCHMFEYAGILCRHVLTVFTVTNVLSLPSHYFLKRWTKTANSTTGHTEYNQGADLIGIEALTLRFTRLCQEAIKFAEVGSVALETYNAALSALRDGEEKMALLKKTIVKITPTNLEKNNKRSLLLADLTPPGLWPLQETMPHRFNLNDAGVTIADLNHAGMTPPSCGQSDANPLPNSGVFTCLNSMTWVIESSNCPTYSAKVAVINLKLQKYGKATPENTELQFRVTKATLEPMLKSLACVNQQLAPLANRAAVINLKLQDTKTSSGETELKFQVSRDSLASMLKSMASLRQQL